MLEPILRTHAERYPLMEVQDAVKLIYQHTFGGGHMISDPVESLKRLRKEYTSVAKMPELPLFEEIGNGLLRVHLAALDTNEYSLEYINDIFVLSAACVHGSLSDFEEKLLFLKHHYNDFHFSFSEATLDTYLSLYKESGYPAVSHSESYKKAYSPAYRVILKKLFK